MWDERSHCRHCQQRNEAVFFFQAEDGIRDKLVTGVQTCALPISAPPIRRFLFEDAVRLLISRGLDEHVIRLGSIVESSLTFARAIVGENCPKQALRALHVGNFVRSEEHTSELQSLAYLVCRLLLE